MVRMFSALRWLKQCDKHCEKWRELFAFLLLVTLLRLPNFFEPYWYGDEAIYLTIGNALRHGLVLYRDIVDHKTPIIYFLAMTPSQWWFRVLLFGWMIATTTFFWLSAQRLLKGWGRSIATLIFVLFTTLPLLEGNIPNGELFVLGFVSAGLLALTQTPLVRVREGGPFVRTLSRQEWGWIVVSGVFLGLATLTKVPAILDVLAIGTWLIWPLFTVKSPQVKHLWHCFRVGAAFSLGWAAPIVLSVLWFWLRGALTEYLQFGLLYNLHYSQNWTPTLAVPALAPLFSLGAKGGILVGIGLLCAAASRWRPDGSRIAWFIWWTACALFASLLSNRPYPHYLIQLVLPLSLTWGGFFVADTCKTGKAAILSITGLITAVVYLLGFGFYPTLSYYQNSFRFFTGSISYQQFSQPFNGILEENARVAQIIGENSLATDRIFIWGTNPMLYAQTQRVPADRFTVAFHIHDLQTYDATLANIERTQPAFIVVMKQEANWPELNTWIQKHTVFVTETPSMRIYRRSAVVSRLLQ